MMNSSGRSGRAGSAALAMALLIGRAGCSSAPPTPETAGAGTLTGDEVTAAAPSSPVAVTSSSPPRAPSASPSPAASSAAEAQTTPSPAPVEVGSSSPEPALRRVAVDREQRHPNGTQMRLTGLAVDERTVKAQVEVINGADRAVTLNLWGEDTAVTDDQGGRYPLLAPEDNTSLEVDAGSSMVGELVFAGRVPEGVSSLELVFNADDGRPADANFAENAFAPRFAFSDLELPA